MKRVVQYFYLRYSEDFQRSTYLNFQSIFQNIRFLLVANIFRQNYSSLNFKTFLSLARLLNIYMSSFSFMSLNKLVYLVYEQVAGSRRLIHLNMPNVAAAKNTRSFFSYRGSSAPKKNKGYGTELKGLFNML